MKAKASADELTYCAFLQAMYKYSRLPHHRSTHARRLKLVQNHIYHKTGRLHPIRRLIDLGNAVKPKESRAKPARSKLVDKSEGPRAEQELSSDPAPPTTHSTDPADCSHAGLPTSHGISRRRPKLVIPHLRNHLRLIPNFEHRPSSADSLPKLQPNSLPSPLPQADISSPLPYTPLEQIAHTPLLPPEIPRLPRVKTDLRVTLTHQSSSEYHTPILSPSAPQDPSGQLFHPLDVLRPGNASANSRPLLRPRQLSYFHPAGPDSTSGPGVGNTLDTSPGVLRTESLASPLILCQQTSPPGLGPAL